MITGFTTAMTGELFSLLQSHSLLAAQLQGAVTADTAFCEGVDDAKQLEPAHRPVQDSQREPVGHAR